MKIFNIILNAVYPNRCISCGEIISDGEFLCEYCYEMTEYTDFSKMCINCGMQKGDCQCKSRVFSFNGCISPFTNKGVAQNAMYRFKFGKVSAAAEYLAKEMAKSVKTVYADIDFDGIAFVPMHYTKKFKRGFNQSEMLAKKLSEILGIRLYQGLISVGYSSVNQHDLPFRERVSNLKGLYKYNYKITGKTVLLVDDIKTTGATLNECSKQLLSAGADNVYCITGLVSELKKGKSKNGN